MKDSDLKLCYIDDNWAWFTTLDVAEQWGDDWNDAPYECNAGNPYSWNETRGARGEKPWDLKKIAFEGPFDTPSSWGSSRWSVQDINTGTIAWLWTDDDPHVNIFAGTTLPEFIELVLKAGGKVYMELLPSDRKACLY